MFFLKFLWRNDETNNNFDGSGGIHARRWAQAQQQQQVSDVMTFYKQMQNLSFRGWVQLYKTARNAPSNWDTIGFDK